MLKYSTLLENQSQGHHGILFSKFMNNIQFDSSPSYYRAFYIIETTQIINPIGQWKLIDGCDYCSTITETLDYGVVLENSHGITSSWSKDVANSIANSLSYSTGVTDTSDLSSTWSLGHSTGFNAGIGGGPELPISAGISVNHDNTHGQTSGNSHSKSNTISSDNTRTLSRDLSNGIGQSMERSYSRAVNKDCSATCDYSTINGKGNGLYLWQWVIYGQEKYNFRKSNFLISACNWLCTTIPEKPQCPLHNCKSSDCDECIDYVGSPKNNRKTECPSVEWIRCANEGETCHIKNINFVKLKSLSNHNETIDVILTNHSTTVNFATIAYGYNYGAYGDSSWTYSEISTNSTDMKIRCDNDAFGSVVGGRKICCINPKYGSILTDNYTYSTVNLEE
eukprot:259643_1